MTSTLTINPPAHPASDEWAFVEEIKQPAVRHVGLALDRAASAGTLDARRGFTLQPAFPDPERLLDTAVDDLRRLLADNGMLRDGGVPIELVHDAQLAHESCRLCIDVADVRIVAGDVEGARRGIYHFEELLLGAEGPVIATGMRERRPWVRNRISRCFFGPIKRPPFNRDELSDDVDYYPEAYLNRLAAHGTNGLWLTIELRDLCTTSITTPPADIERRLEKLRETVAKCRRYGIKVWAFCIEPAAFALDDPILAEHPELAGAPHGQSRCFCPSTPKAQQYLYEATHSLFSQVPHLGGLLNITHGERTTTCLSSRGAIDDDRPVPCPRCAALPKWKILYQSLAAMRAGMKDAAPDSELISWFYMARPGNRSNWVFECAAHLPDDVVLQYNFESNTTMSQLDKPRMGGDYWLSVVGPSSDFARLSQIADRANTEMSAKTQVSCSHELATVPFIPVPSQIYRKYQQMHLLNCRHVMQGWYFGNYPSLMNRAAGAMSFEQDGRLEQDEQSFLLRQARIDWKEHAETVVDAWRVFAEAYRHYPFDNHFQYYGPAQDGVVWPLHLKPVMKPLAPTWRADYPPSGDVIGECLGAFSLSEVLALTDRMADQWQVGTEMLRKLKPAFAHDKDRLREIGVAEAVGVLFDSARNILRFYERRGALLAGEVPDVEATLDMMAGLVHAEIDNTRQMTDLCSQDPTLGFHPEAETYKFHPDRLAWRIECLQELLDCEFPEMRHVLANEGCMRAQRPGQPTYRIDSGWQACSQFRWRLDREGGQLVIRFECDLSEIAWGVMWIYLLDEYGRSSPWIVRCDPEIPMSDHGWVQLEVTRHTDEQLAATARLPSLAWDNNPALQPRHISLRFCFLRQGESEIDVATWPARQDVKQRLRHNYDPAQMGYLLDHRRPRRE